MSSTRGASAPRFIPRERLGDALVARGAITREQLADTLERQRDAGSRLGRELSAQGDVSRLDLYHALAQAWELPFIDLIAEPPDEELLERVGAEAMLRDHWVPHHLEASGPGEGAGADAANGRAVVATAEEPSLELAEQVSSAIGVNEVRFLATTDWDVDQAVLLGCQDELVADAAFGLSVQRPELSAATGWARWQRIGIVVALVLLVISAILQPSNTLIVSLLVINLMFFVGVVFKIAACTVGMVHVSRLRRTQDPRSRAQPVAEVSRIPDDELPVFTILVPAYREANIVSKVIGHLSDLDYPMSKLQVLLLMEADDDETIAAAKVARPPDCVRFVVVPPFGPQTKPKACNVGLALAEGEFLVIYDAEDRPEPGQLREVVRRFAETGDDVACFQARLNYFNARENILTRMFTLEYSMWFDTMLPGLDAWKLPIPLGGTSNHFRVQALRQLGAWDPYNVTEDADLGIRSSAQGMSVGITESTTWEEACSEWKAWIRQRTRWIKGYMVTALVHTRRPRTLWQETGWRGYAGLIGLIAATPAMFLACPLVWGFWLFSFLGGSIAGFHMPHWVLTVTTANLLIGNGAMILIGALAACRRGAYDLMPYSLLNPAYWILHSIAAWRALWQLIFHPSQWEKTPHGIVHGPEAHAAP